MRRKDRESGAQDTAQFSGKRGFGAGLSEGIRNSILGKRIVVIVDGVDLQIERPLISNTVFGILGANGDILNYSELYGGADLLADFFLLRSSRYFHKDLNALIESLKRLRESNPESRIILCALDPSVHKSVSHLLESGVIDVLDDSFNDDIRLLGAAASQGGRR